MNNEKLLEMSTSAHKQSLEEAFRYISGKNDFYSKQVFDVLEMERFREQHIDFVKENMFMDQMRLFVETYKPKLEKPSISLSHPDKEEFIAKSYIFTEEQLKDFAKRLVMSVDTQNPKLAFEE